MRKKYAGNLRSAHEDDVSASPPYKNYDLILNRHNLNHSLTKSKSLTVPVETIFKVKCKMWCALSIVN